MKKKILYTALFALMLASCSEQEFIEQPSTPAGGTEVQFPTDVTSGELLIKFDPKFLTKPSRLRQEVEES